MVNVYFGSSFGEISPEMERDSFNLNKLIFVMTSSGKAHVLHSNNGRIIWSRYYNMIIASTGDFCGDPLTKSAF